MLDMLLVQFLKSHWQDCSTATNTIVQQSQAEISLFCVMAWSFDSGVHCWRIVACTRNKAHDPLKFAESSPWRQPSVSNRPHYDDFESFPNFCGVLTLYIHCLLRKVKIIMPFIFTHPTVAPYVPLQFHESFDTTFWGLKKMRRNKSLVKLDFYKHSKKATSFLLFGH